MNAIVDQMDNVSFAIPYRVSALFFPGSCPMHRNTCVLCVSIVIGMTAWAGMLQFCDCRARPMSARCVQHTHTHTHTHTVDLNVHICIPCFCITPALVTHVVWPCIIAPCTLLTHCIVNDWMNDHDSALCACATEQHMKRLES